MNSIRCLVLLTALALAECATKVNRCKPNTGFIEEDVDLDICKSSPCKLPKKSKVQVSIQFTPEKEIKKLRTHVTGELATIPLPFLGVDGTLVCNKVYTADGKSKASCPLKAGEKYMYKDSIDILPIYPKVKVLVHWSLLDADTGKDITCFEMPAEITS